MMLLLFSCTDPKGYYHECSVGGFTLEACLEAVTVLAASGWKIQVIKLLDIDSRSTVLPPGAFDGQTMLIPIRQLEQEWKTALAQ